VIVCPKCRQHAQITETGKKTMSCQQCGAILETRRLRIFHSSEELADAVAFRTRLQAEISGKGSGTFSLRPSANEDEISKSETENKAKGFELSGDRDSGDIPRKKSQKSIFLELLEAAGGKMGIKELQQKAMEKGMSPEKFDITVKTLLETGEIYSPESGMIRLV
jgi:transcription initiation factor TFIIIB Brf1 subunit/transcription initiation factor TFIIB